MHALEKEEYSSRVTRLCGQAGIISSITAYNEKIFSGCLHCHDNPHGCLVLQGTGRKTNDPLFDDGIPKTMMRE